MEKKNLNELKPLLEIIQQPAVAVCGSSIAYRNQAFSDLGSIAGMTIEAFINTPASMSDRTEERVIRVCGSNFFVAELPLEDGTLYLLKPETVVETTNFLSRIVSAQRNSLQEIYAFGIKAIERSDAEADEHTRIENSVFLRGIHRLTRTLDNMDLYQELVNGRRGLHTKCVFLKTYFAELSEEAGKLLKEAELTLKTTLPEENQLVWLDVDLVEMALWNLLANAGAHAPDKVISLRVSIKGRLLIEVGNAGKLPENRRVFDKKQILPEDDLGFDGVGIGIPLLQEITRIHGGGLIPASTQEGTSLVASFATDIVNKAVVHGSRKNIETCSGMDRGLIGLSGFLPQSCYWQEDILG